MKKILIATLFVASSLFASQATVELTGEFSEKLGNPFKRVLEKKEKTVSIYSENKEVVLKVDSNLSSSMFNQVQGKHVDEIIVNNKTIENVLEDFYSEEYMVQRGDANSDYVVNIVSGSVYITYNETEDTNTVNHINNIVVNLVVMVNGVEKKVTLDKNLFNDGVNYSWAIVINDLNIDFKNYIEKTQMIIENIIYDSLKNKGRR